MDCSATYTSLCLPSFTLQDVLTAFVSSTADCLDNDMFIDTVNFWVYIFIAIAFGAFIFALHLRVGELRVGDMRLTPHSICVSQ